MPSADRPYANRPASSFGPRGTSGMPPDALAALHRRVEDLERVVDALAGEVHTGRLAILDAAGDDRIVLGPATDVAEVRFLVLNRTPCIYLKGSWPRCRPGQL